MVSRDWGKEDTEESEQHENDSVMARFHQAVQYSTELNHQYFQRQQYPYFIGAVYARK